jgi:hypothetical protein
VANEVETEQIAHDGDISDLQLCRATSYVQLRGSVPGLWRQEHIRIAVKPQIEVRKEDPFSMVAGCHFNSLHEKYGTPVHVINLVKRREKRRRHEVILAEMLEYHIENLNTFLPSQDKIKVLVDAIYL